MTQERWDCVSVLLIENRLPEDTPLFVSCSLSCSLYCCCQKHQGWQWWTLWDNKRPTPLFLWQLKVSESKDEAINTCFIHWKANFFRTCMCVYFLNPSKLHLWSKIHCRFSPITTISNLSCTWSRQSDSRGKLHLLQRISEFCLFVPGSLIGNHVTQRGFSWQHSHLLQQKTLMWLPNQTVMNGAINRDY